MDIFEVDRVGTTPCIVECVVKGELASWNTYLNLIFQRYTTEDPLTSQSYTWSVIKIALPLKNSQFEVLENLKTSKMSNT